MNGRMGAGLNNQRQEVTGVRCAAQPCADPIGAVVAFGDGQNEVHATRMAQAGERWKMLELHCGDNVLARIALAAARCQGSRRHSHGLLKGEAVIPKAGHSWRVSAIDHNQKGPSSRRVRWICERALPVPHQDTLSAPSVLAEVHSGPGPRHRLGFPNSGWRGRKDWRLGSRRARGPGRTGGNPAPSKSRVSKTAPTTSDAHHGIETLHRIHRRVTGYFKNDTAVRFRARV